MGWYSPFLFLLLCIGSRYSESVSYNVNCPTGFKQYENRSCFHLFVGQFTFQNGSNSCNEKHSGKLLTISNALQYNRTSTYLKLYGKSQTYWIGLMYRNNSVLTDVDNNSVNASMFGLESTPQPGVGDCVYMQYSGGGLKFVQDNCNSSHNIVCLTEWPAPPDVIISSSPSGYGIVGQQVNLTCTVSSVTGAQPMVLWRFNDDPLPDNDIMSNGGAVYQINEFESSKEGDYSCVVSTAYWSVSSVTMHVGTAVTPNISRPPMNLTVSMGQQGFFECLPDKNSSPKPSVMWYKNGALLNITGQSPKYFVSPNTLTLLLSHVIDDDTGDYHCVLTNAAGNVSSNQSHLEVVSPMSGSGDDYDGSGNSNDDIISVAEGFLLAPQPLTVYVGENATFDCVGPEGTTDYWWIAYDSEDKVIRSRNISIPEDYLFSSWTYTNIQPNTTKVQCAVIFNGTMYSENVTLEVVERAYVTSISNDTAIQYGDETELTCKYGGAPHPMIKWLFNGNPVDLHAAEYKIEDQLQLSVLTVKSFQPSSVGVYQCLVSNQYGADISSTILYGKDGQPGNIIASLFTISKHQVSVSWFFISNPNSDPGMIQLQVTWTDANNLSVVPQSILLPLSAKEYVITDLNPFYHLSVIVVAVTPSVRGLEVALPLIYPFGNAPDYAPTLIHVWRSHDDEALNVSWAAIIPDHSKGEGDIFDYEIEYRNKKIDNAAVLEQVSGTWVYIEGLYSKGVYEVRVRCIVMVQSIPMATEYEKGPWSEWQESDGAPVTAAAITASHKDNSAQVAVPVSIVCGILVLLAAALGIYLLCKWIMSKFKRSDRDNITYSSMKNENADEEEVQL